LAVITVAVIKVPISVGVKLTALSFPEGAIIIYSILFLTLERE
jgi:hypothetical protein